MRLAVRGLDAAFRKLQQRIDLGARKALRAAGDVVVTAIKWNFDNSMGPEGQWDPVPYGWLVQRETFPRGQGKDAYNAYVQTAKPLIDTGALRESIMYYDGETKQGGITGAVDTLLPYAVQHNEGVEGEIRKREFMYVRDEDVSEAASYADYEMREALTA